MKQLSKQHQLLISEAVENEIEKITEGIIPEFRDSFVKWRAVVVCAANEASRDWLRDRLPQLVPWEGAKLRMGELSAPLFPYPESMTFRRERQSCSIDTRTWEWRAGVCMLTIQTGTGMPSGPVWWWVCRNSP